MKFSNMEKFKSNKYNPFWHISTGCKMNKFNYVSHVKNSYILAEFSMVLGVHFIELLAVAQVVEYGLWSQFDGNPLNPGGEITLGFKSFWIRNIWCCTFVFEWDNYLAQWAVQEWRSFLNESWWEKNTY